MTNEFFNDDFLAAFRNAKNNAITKTESSPVLSDVQDVNETTETLEKDKSSLTLLTKDERFKLVNILNYIRNVKDLVKKYIVDNDNRTRNAILIHGPAGNGKTTMMTELMSDLKASGDIIESNLVTGHITQIGLTGELLAHNAISKSVNNPLKNIRSITIFDDTDIFDDKKTFQILKNAFNTKNKDNNNRFVCCKSKNSDIRYNYRGIGIFICNNDFVNSDDFDVQAFLSRCEDIEIRMTTEELFIYGKYLLENAIKEDVTYDYSKTEKFIKFFNETLQAYYNNGVFNKLFFSLRTMMVLKDNFDESDNSWLTILNEFKRLVNTNNEIIKSRELLNKIEKDNKDKLNSLLSDANSNICAFVNANLTSLVNKYSFDYVLKATEILKNAENVYNKYKGKTNNLSIEENREYKRASHDFFIYKKDGFYNANANKEKNAENK